MNTQKKKIHTLRRTGIGTGTISLLVIFTVLCFSSLALLSLTAAASNGRIHQRSLIATQNMAQAEGQAAQQLARIDDMLYGLQIEYVASEASGESTADAAYYTAALLNAQEMGCTVDMQNHTVSFTVPIDKNNMLFTTLHLLPPSSQYRYELTEQYSSMGGNWEPDEEIQLWEG